MFVADVRAHRLLSSVPDQGFAPTVGTACRSWAVQSDQSHCLQDR